jgi:hypothetical protein
MSAPELPRWRSHKEVGAAPFVRVDGRAGNGDLLLAVGDPQSPTVISAPGNIFARGTPEPGDYIVRYDDGYMSWSPKKAFEEGYTRFSPGEPQHVFEGQPDARQSASVTEAVSRFRPRYRALTDEEKAIHDDLKAAFEAVEQQIMRIKGGRYRALALTSLEESCMWAVKELTG